MDDISGAALPRTSNAQSGAKRPVSGVPQYPRAFNMSRPGEEAWSTNTGTTDFVGNAHLQVDAMGRMLPDATVFLYGLIVSRQVSPFRVATSLCG